MFGGRKKSLHDNRYACFRISNVVVDKSTQNSFVESRVKSHCSGIFSSLGWFIYSHQSSLYEYDAKDAYECLSR
ncbi:hypothetical protein MCY_00087 [Bartonella rattimassiliensis 15908]|uniref:Uncharacterized protein n=1 Tax=Bartonella rattimassiliensis 15908 TaxID=1094556 RepID=J0QPV5_9HYPH|nr:hypothetical protein MCY_00087 [Bartonella rattimassiliensis 15908]